MEASGACAGTRGVVAMELLDDDERRVVELIAGHHGPAERILQIKRTVLIGRLRAYRAVVLLIGKSRGFSVYVWMIDMIAVTWRERATLLGARRVFAAMTGRAARLPGNLEPRGA